MGPAIVLAFWLLLAGLAVTTGFLILLAFRAFGALRSSIWVWVAAAPGAAMALAGIAFAFGPYLIGPLLPDRHVYKVVVGEDPTPDVVVVDSYARAGTDFMEGSVEFRASPSTFARLVSAHTAKDVDVDHDEFGLDDPIYRRGRSCSNAKRFLAEETGGWETMVFVDCRDTGTFFVSGSYLD